MSDALTLVDERKKAAQLIKSCLQRRILVRDALRVWPNYNQDPTTICAKYALIHYEADDELQKADKFYADEQKEWLLTIIDILEQGESIPLNIIQGYKELYDIPISFKHRLKAKFITILLQLKKYYSLLRFKS